MPASDEKIYVGDEGTRFNFTIMEEGAAVNLTGYTSLQVRFQRPDKTTFDRTLEVVDETVGEVRYTTLSTDLDQAGRWHFQLMLDLAEWDGSGSLGSFWVHKPIESSA